MFFIFIRDFSKPGIEEGLGHVAVLPEELGYREGGPMELQDGRILLDQPVDVHVEAEAAVELAFWQKCSS